MLYVMLRMQLPNRSQKAEVRDVWFEMAIARTAAERRGQNCTRFPDRWPNRPTDLTPTSALDRNEHTETACPDMAASEEEPLGRLRQISTAVEVVGPMLDRKWTGRFWLPLCR